MNSLRPRRAFFGSAKGIVTKPSEKNGPVIVQQQHALLAIASCIYYIATQLDVLDEVMKDLTDSTVQKERCIKVLLQQLTELHRGKDTLQTIAKRFNENITLKLPPKIEAPKARCTAVDDDDDDQDGEEEESPGEQGSSAQASCTKRRKIATEDDDKSSSSSSSSSESDTEAPAPKPKKNRPSQKASTGEKNDEELVVVAKIKSKPSAPAKTKPVKKATGAGPKNGKKGSAQ